MWILLLIFTSISFAEELSSARYCFNSPQRAQVARQKLEMILVPSDVINTDGNCLVVQMRPHRYDLIQRYTLATFPDVTIAFSSEDVQREPCRLKVEKVKERSTDDLNIEFSKQQNQMIKVETKAQANEVIEIETIKEFEITVDQDQVLGTCRLVTPTRYNIQIEIKKNPKPIIPQGLPPGSIVIMNQRPSDQETSSIKSELQLNKGERVNVGEIVKKLKDKDRTLDIKPQVNLESGQQSVTEKVFLSLQ
jgi:hypothetical protein